MSQTTTEKKPELSERQKEEYRQLYDQGVELLRSVFTPPQAAIELLNTYIENLDSGSDINQQSGSIQDKRYLILLAVQEHLLKEKKMMQAKYDKVTSGYEEVITLLSHELKNLLTTAQGYNILLEKKVREENRQDLLELHLSGHRVINKMFIMIDALLKMTLTERNLLNPEPRLVDFVEDIVKPLQIELKFDLNNKKMSFSNKIQTKKTVIYADEQLIEIIMRNLLENAIKYGDWDTVIEVTVNSTKKKLQVSVKNSCNFLPENICDGIFEKFKTVKLSNIKSGTGIGLYNVKNLLRLHNGDITCTAQAGKWIQFKFFIPFTSDKRISG